MDKNDQILALLVEMKKENDERFNQLTQEITGVKQEVSDIKQEITGVKQEVSGVKQEVSSIKQEITGIKQQLNKMDQDNNKAVEMLAGHMIDHTTRLERIEAVQKENTEKLNDIPTIKQMVLNHEFNFQKMRIS